MEEERFYSIAKNFQGDKSGSGYLQLHKCCEILIKISEKFLWRVHFGNVVGYRRATLMTKEFFRKLA